MSRSTRCYGEMMAHAASEGFDCPESYASAMRSARELHRAQEAADTFADLEEAGPENQPDTQQKESREPDRS